MTPLHIAVDMDDVLVDFVPAVLHGINRDFGTKVSLGDVTSWDMDEGALADVNFGHGRGWMDWLKDNRDVWRYADLMPGAFSGLHRLRNAGHTLEILTCKPAWAEYIVWMFMVYYDIPPQKVTILPPDGHKERHSEADILIDDALHHVLPWSDTCRPAILFDRPWNRHHKGGLPGRVVRANGWAGILETLNVAP